MFQHWLILSSRKYFYPLIFFILLSVIYLLCGVFEALPLAPQSIHAWAQSDRASVAAIYYYEKMDLFHPRVYNLLNGTGYTGMEFPLINYSAACLYKVFGFHNFWYRFLVMCIVTTGMYASFRIACDVLNHKPAALFITLLWVLSPVFLFYTPNFLSDAASLGFIMIAWLAFFQLQKKFSVRWLMVLFFFGTFATLVKITSSISILSMIGLLLPHYLKWLSIDPKNLFKHKHWLISSLLLTLFITSGWYQYAAYLNVANFSEMFHLGISPPENFSEAISILRKFPDFFLYDYYSPFTLITIVCLVPLLAILSKKINRMMGLLVLGMGAANGCFIYLQLQKYLPHDYYILTILPWVFFLFVTTAKLILEKITVGKFKTTILILLAGILCYNTAYCKRLLTYRYDQNNSSYYENAFHAYYNVQPILREKGINRTDTIITLVDYTPNLSLYLMGNKGYSLIDKDYGPGLLFLIEERNAKYLITNREISTWDPFVRKVIGKPVFKHQNLRIYKPKRNQLIRHLMDSALDARFVLPYQIMKEIDYWGENIKNFAAYLQLPLRNVERQNALKWFRVIDSDLTIRFGEYKKNHTGEEQVLRNKFAADQKLGREEKYVWENPYQTWFRDLEKNIPDE